MLTPEQAKQVLEARQVQNNDQYQLTAIVTLPVPMRAIAFGIAFDYVMGQSPDQTHARSGEVRRQSIAQLATLHDAERQSIFAVFFPQIASAAELAWQRLAELPYQTGYATLPFRAPHHPDIVMERRQNWLTTLFRNISIYHEDIIWLAHHAAYIRSGYLGDDLGVLFAAVIDGDPLHGDAVFTILLDSAKGEDEIGTMGQHIPQALLTAARPDGWEFIGKLLLAAQRQEGLRQVILGCLDNAHPQAFRHLLHIIVDHDLARFSAVTLALNGWLGAKWDSAEKTKINHMLQRLLTLLEEPQSRQDALTAGNGKDVYLALWASATADVIAAIDQTTALVADAAVERRFAAVHFLAETMVPAAAPGLLCALDDADMRIVARACSGLRALSSDSPIMQTLPIFEGVEAVLQRIPKQTLAGEPLVWEWLTASIDREQVAGLLIHYVGERDPRRLIPYLPLFDHYQRVRVAEQLAEKGAGDPAIRVALFALLRDRATWIGERIIALLDKHGITVAEIPQLDALLTRKATDLRRGLIALLAKQADDVVLASADRLIAARDEQQRHAGLELLRVLHEQQRAVAACGERATAYAAAHVTLSASETALLAPILDVTHAKPTLTNALGLADPADCAPIPAPTLRPVQIHADKALANIRALDALIHEHREATYVANTWQGPQEVLLGADTWHFPQPDLRETTAKDSALLPLADIWRGWAEQLAVAQRDEDGLHFVRMSIVLAQLDEHGTLQGALQGIMGGDIPAGPHNLRYFRIIQNVCAWLVRLYPAPDTADFLLDYVVTTLVTLPAAYLREPDKDEKEVTQRQEPMFQAIRLARSYATDCEAAWRDEHWGRLWQLLRWTTLLRHTLRHSPSLHETLEAARVGVATTTDITMQLLGPRPAQRYGRASFEALSTLSARKPHALFTHYPSIVPIYADCMRRVLEVELQRGEMPTEATPAALSLHAIAGADWLIRIVQALDTAPIKRGYSYNNDGKAYTLSHLLRATYPDAQDTPATFLAQVTAAHLSEQQLVAAAVYAPQWAHFIEHALGWAAFADAVWWIHAHTRDRAWHIDKALRESWEAQSAERTPIANDDLFDGAVDVAWFQRVYAALGATRWEMLDAAAKYASGGSGHARARLFADAMLGRLETADVIKRIQTKRHQDSVCALGLLPLPTKQRDRAILQRYQVYQEFLRTSRKFGAQRRESEGKATRIGLDNLARMAGYSDPLRFQWAMELQEIADLRAGPISRTYGDVALTLRIDALGQPHLDVARNGKPLKQIPPRLKQEPDVIQLRERKHSLEQQVSRMRLALEQAMCREETFSADELARLLGHPLLAPLLEQLIFVGASGMGYLVDGGSALRQDDGRDLPMAATTLLRIAHPYDLYRSGKWSQWQRECFVAERIQPFKQIFRELYLLTEAEQRDGTISRRYAGQQIQPRQAMALLGQRGWVGGDYADTSRTFHERGLTASLTQIYGGHTSVDVEGLTIDGVMFSKAGVYGALPLVAVPPIVFSETMRDVDLVVSVAHRGGVDPETSASTVTMRTALIHETAALLGFTNIRLHKSHAFITGELGEYSVHLGSGVVHLIPGGALCIIPVHAQHRGRLFLPFADDDPKTAEIMSKILLLARDKGITDPLILKQIYARA